MDISAMTQDAALSVGNTAISGEDYIPAVSVEDAQRIYESVRDEFYFPPTNIEFVCDEDDRAPFCIANMTVHFNLREIINEAHCRSMLLHEIGHPHYAPRNMSDKFRHIKYVCQKYSMNVDTAAMFLNVVYDIIVDFNIRLTHNDKPGMGARFDSWMIRDQKRYEKSMKENPIFKLLIILECCYAGGRYYIQHRKQRNSAHEINNIAAKSIRICRNILTLDAQVEQLCELIYEMFSRHAKKEQKEFEKALNKALKQLGELVKGLMTAQTIEGAKSPEAAKRAIFDLGGDAVPGLGENPKKQGSGRTKSDNNNGPGNEEDEPGQESGLMGQDLVRGILRGLAKASKVSLKVIDYYRMKAKRNIKFAIKGKHFSGNAIPAGTSVWDACDTADSFRITDGLYNCGINIPGITARKQVVLPGSVLPNSNSKRIMLIMDTSGSMDKDEVVIVVFSFIAAAEANQYEAGVIMFSDDAYFAQAPSKAYRKLEELVWDNYKSGGTSMIPALVKAKEIANGSFVLIVSDFYAEPMNDIEGSLTELSNGNTVKAVVLCSNMVPGNVPSIKVDDANMLDGILIDEIETRSISG